MKTDYPLHSLEKSHMISCNILFSADGKQLPINQVVDIVNHFGESYSNTTSSIIKESCSLDEKGDALHSCAASILSNFGMTRQGIFKNRLEDTLTKCWEEIGLCIIEQKNQILDSHLSRNRFIIDINDQDREETIHRVWEMTKRILPYTMSPSSYGLVGASKILFSVLPEIVVPVDNVQWKQLFKTVDLGDVIKFMVTDIRKWEDTTKVQLDTVDKQRRLTPIPSIYNAIAMEMRPK